MSANLQMALFEEEVLPLPQRIGSAKVEKLSSKHILTPGRGKTGAYDYSLNSFRGCTFGCSYCYAAFFVPEDDKREHWGRWVEAKVRAVESLRKHDIQGKRIFMSTVTDPYQPLEAKISLTRSILGVLLESQPRLVIQTRSPLVLRDLDLLKRFEHVRVNLSITTDDDEVRRTFEPMNPSIERRLETARELRRQGIPFSICLAPLLPVRSPDVFAMTLAGLGPKAVSAVWFRRSDRPFASNTREGALEMAASCGWDRSEFDRTLEAMRRWLPDLDTDGAAFSPE